MSERIEVGREGRIGRITLRCGPLNVLGTQDVRDLHAAVGELAGCAIVLLGAAGQRAFSAGMEIADHTPAAAPAMLAAFGEMAAAFAATPSVLVANVGAAAMGGGFEIVLLCDLAICSDAASFALPEIKLAALPPVACALLPQIVGRQRALDLILTGRRIDAAEAERLGIVTRCVPHDDLESAVANLCAQLSALSEDALRACKRATVGGDLREALRLYTGELLQTRDAAEGIAAFLERRPPQWSHHNEEIPT